MSRLGRQQRFERIPLHRRFQTYAVSQRTTFSLKRHNNLGSALRHQRIAPYVGDDICNLVRNLRTMCPHLRKFGLGD
jgi:hypothetical protein